LGQSTFGGLGGTKSSISSFATPGSNTIRGLSSKPVKPFGAAEEPSSDVEGDDEDGNDDDGSDDEGSEKSKQADQGKRFNFAPQECKLITQSEMISY
jgi:Ran-binding protein 3